MKKRQEEELETPIASLIDVVFLLIIFFVVTATVDKDIRDDTIRLAQAKYAKAADITDPRTVTINVRRNGGINVALTPMNRVSLTQYLKGIHAESGSVVPVLIRGDREAIYEHVDTILQAVGDAGLWRVKLSSETEGQ